MDEYTPKLEFSKKIQKCVNCGKLTHFFVTVEELSYSALFYTDEKGKFRVVSDLVVKEPDKHFYEFPTCLECYRKEDDLNG